MIAYCLFCNTIKREDVATVLRKRMEVRILAPKIIQRKWVKGKALEVVHDFMPGYLFMYAQERIQDFSPLFRLEDFYRILGERSEGYCLMGSDLAFAEMLLGCDGTIGVLKTYKAGDRVRLAEGALGRVDGEVLRLDRRGRALVRFNFDGTAMQSWVAIEMLEDGAPTAVKPLKPEERKETAGKRQDADKTNAARDGTGAQRT